MTQKSRPWAGRTIGDAGAYTHENWWDVWQAMQRASGALVGAGNVGVFYAVPGQLAPTSAVNNSITIAAGAALIDGLFYNNDAPVTFAVASATGGNERDDRVVLRKTFSGLTQTARLVLLPGGEVASPGPGTPPALTQDTTRATYWDTPIARVNVTDGGVITITDERNYIDAEDKQFLLSFDTARNVTDNTDIIRLPGLPPGIEFLATKEFWTSTSYTVPSDYISDMELDVISVWLGAGGDVGDANINLSAYWSKIGVNSIASTRGVPAILVPVVIGDNGLLKVLYGFALVPPDAGSNPAIGDIISVIFSRDGADGSDDLAGTLIVIGIRVRYFGWK